jgi:hypothetical protein
VSISFRIPFIISCSWTLVRVVLWWIFIQSFPKRGQNQSDHTANWAIASTIMAVQLRVMVRVIENKKHWHDRKSLMRCKCICDIFPLIFCLILV